MPNWCRNHEAYMMKEEDDELKFGHEHEMESLRYVMWKMFLIPSILKYIGKKNKGKDKKLGNFAAFSKVHLSLI